MDVSPMLIVLVGVLFLRGTKRITDTCCILPEDASADVKFSCLMVDQVASGISKGYIYICACFAREGQYLQEWIDYHLGLGFDQVVLYDTNTGTQDLEYVEKVKSNRVTIVDRRNVNFNVSYHGQCFTEFYQQLHY